ncbi:hypothetical protein P3T73_14115 [Kiritimatiellota bacterium B12222]|nr:hypothetical protein P3T73_14115 [Kiritimatiellota bacterium B12222]
MKISLCMSLLTCAFFQTCPLWASVYYVDFGRSNITTPGNWNNVTSATSLTDIVDENGVNTAGIDLAFGGNVGGSNNDSSLTYTTDFPDTANRDFIYTTGTMTLTLSDLNPSQTYSLKLFASRVTGDNRTTLFTITNGTLNASSNQSLFVSNNTGTTITFTDVVPTAGNQISLSIAPQDAASNWGYISALEITAIPEPRSFLLFIAGAGFVLIHLKRKRCA